MYLKTLMFILFVCVCDVQRGGGHPCITVHVWMAEDKLDGASSFLLSSRGSQGLNSSH